MTTRIVLKQIKNALVFAALFYLIHCAVFQHNTTALNVLKFLTGFSAFSYLMVLASSGKKAREKVKGKPRDGINKLYASYQNGEHFPEWLDNALYLAVTIMLAAGGHYWLAAGWIFIGTIDLKSRDAALEEQEQAKSAAEPAKQGTN